MLSAFLAGPYCNTRKGRSGARQFQPGDCDPNCDHFDLRVVHRCFHEEPVQLEYRKTNLDLSDLIGHCHRLILDVATVDKLSVVIAIALEKPRRVQRLGSSMAAILLHKHAHLASLGRRAAHLFGRNRAGVGVMATLMLLQRYERQLSGLTRGAKPDCSARRHQLGYLGKLFEF